MTNRDRIVQPEGWPRPKGYANGILVESGCRLLAVSGQVGWNQDEKFPSREFAPQFRQALQNVITVVKTAGGRAEHIIRLTFYVVDRQQYREATAELGRTYRELLGDHYVACTLVEVKALLEDEALVEIEATAAIPSSTGS